MTTSAITTTDAGETPNTTVESRIGIFPGIRDTDYHAVDAASHSRLVKLRGRTPLHCRYAIDNPEESDALIIGSATHCLALQPSLYAKRFEVSRFSDFRSKESQKYRDDCEARGLGVLSAKQHDMIKAMVNSVLDHPAARVLLEADGDCELSAFWNDPEHGIPCKARFDKLAKFDGLVPCIVDLKTTEDASPEEFAKSIYSWGYHIQAAHYLYGAELLGLKAAGFAIIAVEKKPPHPVAVYELSNKTIGAGWQELQKLLATYAECVKTNKWPGYSIEPQQISLPDWAMKKLEGAI